MDNIIAFFYTIQTFSVKLFNITWCCGNETLLNQDSCLLLSHNQQQHELEIYRIKLLAITIICTKLIFSAVIAHKEHNDDDITIVGQWVIAQFQ